MFRLSINFFKYCLTTAVGIGMLSSSAQALTIVPTDDEVDLVATILGEGIGVPRNSISYTGVDNASALFTDGLSSGLGIESGIILTTGNAADAIGPNSSEETGTNNLLRVSDTNLSDPVFLDFQFESDGGDLFLNYVFASDEYSESVNDPNFGDVFAFLIDGVNIALIPGTNTPVGVETVNGGNPIGTNASNPELFNNNAIDDGAPFALEYDGFTDVFTATVLDLAPGTYNARLAIADTTDGLIDSAIFIEAGSFSSQASNQTVPESSTLISLLAFGTLGLGSKLRSRQKQTV